MPLLKCSALRRVAGDVGAGSSGTPRLKQKRVPSPVLSGKSAGKSSGKASKKATKKKVDADDDESDDDDDDDDEEEEEDDNDDDDSGGGGGGGGDDDGDVSEKSDVPEDDEGGGGNRQAARRRSSGLEAARGLQGAGRCQLAHKLLVLSIFVWARSAPSEGASGGGAGEGAGGATGSCTRARRERLPTSALRGSPATVGGVAGKGARWR